MTDGTRVSIAAAGGLSAEIDLLGAELSRLCDADGADLLWDGDPAVWSGRAPVLFPIIGRLREDTYRYRGASYTLAKHGFARRLPWALVAQADDRATFRLEDGEATRPGFPFPFRLDLTFAVSADALAMTASLTNTGTDVMPFNFGFHPALRWPLPGGGARADARLVFDREEVEDIARLDSEGLIARTEPNPLSGRELALNDAMFAGDALIFRGLRSRGLTFEDGGARALRADFPHFPDLGIWTKPGASYLCIEPWLGYADPADFDGEIFGKPGICTLQPGHGWQATMTIAIVESGA